MREEQKVASLDAIKAAMVDAYWAEVGTLGRPMEAALTAARSLGCLLPEEAAGLREELEDARGLFVEIAKERDALALEMTGPKVKQLRQDIVAAVDGVITERDTAIFDYRQAKGALDAARMYERAALAERDALAARLKVAEEVAADAVSGLRYIIARYGRLDGVGWDRVLDARAALTPPPSAEGGTDE